MRTLLGTNLCVRRPLEVKGKGIRGVEEAADVEAYTVHSMNIIYQRLYFVAYCLRYMRLFSFYPQVSDVMRNARFSPGYCIRTYFSLFPSQNTPLNWCRVLETEDYANSLLCFGSFWYYSCIIVHEVNSSWNDYVLKSQHQNTNSHNLHT
jgi:hypothetical protein